MSTYRHAHLRSGGDCRSTEVIVDGKPLANCTAVEWRCEANGTAHAVIHLLGTEADLTAADVELAHGYDSPIYDTLLAERSEATS